MNTWPITIIVCVLQIIAWVSDNEALQILAPIFGLIWTVILILFWKENFNRMTINMISMISFAYAIVMVVCGVIDLVTDDSRYTTMGFIILLLILIISWLSSLYDSIATLLF